MTNVCGLYNGERIVFLLNGVGKTGQLHVKNKIRLLSYNGAVVKNPPAFAGNARNVGSVPGLETHLGVGNCNSLQYSCLENTMDRGAW